MKPIFCTLIAVLLSTGYANATKISVETARQEAISFFKKKHLIQNDSVVKQADSNTDAYYIFCNDKQDCVIISGSDKTPARLFYNTMFYEGYDPLHMDFSSSDGVLLAQKELKTYVYTTNTAHIKSNIKICNAYDSTLVPGIMQYHIKPGKNKAVLTIENNDTVPFRDLIHLYRTVNSTSVVETKTFI
ncbi:MAG: Spi family protease inhibitor [Paludibacteraceae bacterium]|nr:Spi family protease inhibitor [Paludibacteraceae bacterium]